MRLDEAKQILNDNGFVLEGSMSLQDKIDNAKSYNADRIGQAFLKKNFQHPYREDELTIDAWIRNAAQTDNGYKVEFGVDYGTSETERYHISVVTDEDFNIISGKARKLNTWSWSGYEYETDISSVRDIFEFMEKHHYCR